MNGKACKGLMATEVALRAYMEGDETKFDPEMLIQDTREDWATMFQEDMDRANNKRTTEDDAVAACRDWYDWKGYAKPFCCQMILETDNGDMTGDARVVDATGTSKADSIEYDKKCYDFGALTFKGAQALASGMAIFSTVVALMN
jgi:hypothetical protein